MNMFRALGSQTKSILIAVLLCAAFTASCGGGSVSQTTTATSNANTSSGFSGTVTDPVLGTLTGVSITPTTADGQNFPGGLVTFQGHATWSNGALVGTLLSWCVAKSATTCAGTNDTVGAVVVPSVITGPGVGLAQNVQAQCNAGFNGQVTILAGILPLLSDKTNPPPFTANQFGSATLTCP